MHSMLRPHLMAVVWHFGMTHEHQHDAPVPAVPVWHLELLWNLPEAGLPLGQGQPTPSCVPLQAPMLVASPTCPPQATSHPTTCRSQGWPPGSRPTIARPCRVVHTLTTGTQARSSQHRHHLCAHPPCDGHITYPLSLWTSHMPPCLQVDMSLPKLSETKERYSDPTGQTDPNSFGTRSEFFSKGGLALCSGTSRIKDGTGMDYKSWA